MLSVLKVKGNFNFVLILWIGFVKRVDYFILFVRRLGFSLYLNSMSKKG